MVITLEDILILTRTIYGEARGEPWRGQLAVGLVVRNRAVQEHMGITTVFGQCLAPNQFSVWWQNNANTKETLSTGVDDPVMRKCADVAIMALRPDASDVTYGALYYAVKNVQRHWMEGMSVTTTIGSHKFLKPLG